VKVTLKNTRILFYLSIANIPVCALIFLLVLGEVSSVLINILLGEFCPFFILTLIYLIRILLRFNEATAVVAAYTMFTGILAISIIDTLFPHLLNPDYGHWLGTLTLVISLLVAFRSFFVKTAFISLPFRLFGAGIGLLALPKLFVLMVATTFNQELISISGDIGILVILLATCFILRRMMAVLRNRVEPPVEAADEHV
jgi:hypothetical protein